ncbi:hypothetical protein QYF36_002896 [Acer negundo]|nr:hypothetical protein QYF36_002896 [Acer negundo]
MLEEVVTSSRWRSISVARRSPLKSPDLAWPDPDLLELAIRLISTVISWVSTSPPPPLMRFVAPGGSDSSVSLWTNASSSDLTSSTSPSNE